MKLSVHSPVGWLRLTEDEGAITQLDWAEGGVDETPLLREGARQLEAYFAGALERFDLPLRVEASDFQRRVCEAMLAIPFGEVRSYGDLSKELGVPAQAVGQGCGGNPIPVIIPCHRVMGASGLGGFSGAGGVETKVWLLKHEKAGGILI